MKTKNIRINFETLVDYLQGKLSKEEEKTVNFELFSDEKNYWQFIGLRALKNANLLDDYLNTDLNSNLNTYFLEDTQITQKEIIDYIQNKLNIEENKKIKTILSKNEKANFEFIKLNALFEEQELDNYLNSKNSFINSILEKIQNQIDEDKTNKDKTNTNESDQIIEGTKYVTLKRYFAFAASFILLFTFSYLIYDYIQKKQENKQLALENKKSENKQNQSPTIDYQTLGTDQTNKTEDNKLDNKLLIHTEDATDIFMTNLSIIAKKTKEQKKQNSESNLTMIKEYLSTQNLETKINVVLIDKENKSKTIEFTNSETFFEWFLNQEKAKSILLTNYTAIITDKNKKTNNKIIIKDRKIQNSIPAKFSDEQDFKVQFVSLSLEIK